MDLKDLRKMMESLPEETLVLWESQDGTFLGLAEVQFQARQFLMDQGKICFPPALKFKELKTTQGGDDESRNVQS